MDCCTGLTRPLVQTQPSQNADSAKSALPLVSDADFTTARNGSKIVGDEEELPGKTKSSRTYAEPQSSGNLDHLFQPFKLLRTKSKIVDKVKAFEECCHSTDSPKVPPVGISWSGFSQKAFCDSEDGGSKRNRTSDEHLSNVALKRTMNKQRASSLEEWPNYTQKVHTFQIKFSEELQRIKKLVGRPNIKKSFSTEHLAEAVKQPMAKVEPVPQITDRVLDDKKSVVDSVELPRLCLKNPAEQAKVATLYEPPKPNNKVHGLYTENQFLKDVECSQLKNGTGNLEEVLVNKEHTNRLPNLQKKILKGTFSSMPINLNTLDQKQLPKKDQKSFEKEQSSFQDNEKAPPKPPRLGTASSSSQLFKGSEEILFLAPKMSIPTIIIEDEPVNKTKELIYQTNAKQMKEKEKEVRSKQKLPMSAQQGKNNLNEFTF